MAIIKCPKCGSSKTQLTNVKSKHSLIWLILFGWIWVIWLMIKWMIGFTIFICYDWWMMIIKKNSGKGYVPASKGWFAFIKREYYCNDCGNNFRG